MRVQGLLLPLGAGPQRRIDGVSGFVGVGRHAGRVWLCGWARVEGRRAAMPLSARGVQIEACTLFGAARPKFQPCLRKHLFGDCLFPSQPLD